jgi:hypothetical protein
MKWFAPLLLILPVTALGAVGSITEISGAPAQVERSKQKITANKGTGVEMNDRISTAKTKLGITFEDKTRVQITEQSRLIIDDFVYDPKKKDAGKMAMKVAIGTVRYASGQVAKNDPQKVAIKTPTASIAVRGTDFTMTVDEVGRSLVILLPSCPPNYKKQEECVVGEIEVSTDAGAVIMNQAFQATVAANANQPPSPPRIIDINESLINNLLIVSPPKEIANDMRSNSASDQNISFLDKDYLEYRELTKNLLEDDLLKFSDLDINRLDADYLDNMLDLITKTLLADDALDAVDPVLPNIKNYPWIPKAYNEENIFLFSERPPHIASITVERNVNATANIIQDGVEANVIMNSGGTNVVFNIRQTQ